MAKFFSVVPIALLRFTLPCFLPSSCLLCPFNLLQLFHPHFSGAFSSQRTTLLQGHISFPSSLTVAYCSSCHPWLFPPTAQTLCFSFLPFRHRTQSVSPPLSFTPSILIHQHSRCLTLMAPGWLHSPSVPHGCKGQWKGHGDKKSCPRRSSAAASRRLSTPG